MWEVMAEGSAMQVRMSKAGTRCQEIAKAIHDYQLKNGMQKYLYQRFAHGEGMEGHQEPYIALGDETVLEEGMTRSRRLNQQQLEEVGTALRQTPREAGLSGNLWDGKTLAVWIGQQYGITLGVRQCQRLFRQLGFRLRQPRPQIALADAERQKTHKKTPGADGRPDRRPLGQ